MTQFKIYRKDNYIIIVNNTSQETQYGFVKEVFIDKSNINLPNYKILNVKDFPEQILKLEQFLKEDGTPYTQEEFETFYTQNTGNFNSGGIPDAPEDGVQYARQDGEWTEITGGGSDLTLQQVLNSGSTSVGKEVRQLNEVDGDTGSYLQYTELGFFNPTNSSVFNVNQLVILDSNFNIDIRTSQTYYTNNITGKQGTLDFSTVNNNNVTLIFPFNKPSGSYKLITEDDLIPSIHIVPSGNFTISDGTKTRIITATDTNDQTITLPAIPDSIGSIYFITNKSSGLISNLSVVSKTGTNDLFDGGTYVNNKILTYGMSLRFFNDSTNFIIIG